MAASISPWTRALLGRPICVCRSASKSLLTKDIYDKQNVSAGSIRERSSESSSSVPPSKPKPVTTNKAVTITRAMRAYMESAKNYDDMMSAEVADFEKGKRHLANIMGEDPDNFTQDDVDRAIEYLLPSGIFDKRARPVMKNPYEIFPLKKAAQFGMDGRPYHWMYFTTIPNYYTVLYESAWKMEDLKALEDKQNPREQKEQAQEVKNFHSLTIARSEWLSFRDLSTLLVEKISEKEYNHFLVLMERMVAHPLSYTQSEFIMKYRKPIEMQSSSLEIPEIDLGEDGRSFATASGARKKISAVATVYHPGSGKVSINGRDITYFKNNLYRENLLTPLIVTDLVGEVDVVAEVEEKGGPTGQCGAIRHALSNALTAFVDDQTRENLRLTGMLTKDPRVRERKKPGQERARKKFTWKKR